MKFELVPKHRAKLTDVGVQSLKMGQTDVVPAIELTFKVTLPNSALNMLDKNLLPFLFEKGNSGAAVQQTLDGVDVISDMPSLTRTAGDFDVVPKKKEQTGCSLHIYQGVTGDSNIKLSDGTVKVRKFHPKEGGAVEFEFDFYAADLDAETMGMLGVLKSHDLDIELTAPEVTQQRNVDDDEQEEDENGNPFPVDADKASTSANSPFTPEAALAAAVCAEAPTVTVKRGRLAAVGK